MEACIKIFENGLYINQVVNVGNNVETTMIELANEIINITKSNYKIVYIPQRKERDMRRRLPDISKMKSVLSRDLVPLSEGLKNIISCMYK